MKRILMTALVAVALAGCGSDNDEKKATPCEAACARAVAAACPNDDNSTCVQDCGSVYQFLPACAAQIDAYINCVASAPFQCVDGFAEPTATCTAEEAAIISCGGAGLPLSWR